MYKHRITIALATLCLSASSVVAQSLSLREARRLALQSNKGIAIAHETEQKAEATHQAMKTNALPKLSLQAFAYYATPSESKELQLGELPTSKLLEHSKLAALAQSNPQIAQLLQPLAQVLPQSIALPSLPLQLSLNNSYYAALNIDQPIYMGGKITAAKEMARIGKELAQHNSERSRQDILLKVDEAYNLLLQAQELQQTAESYERAVGEVARIVEQAVRAGMRTKNDILRVNVEQSKAQLQLQRAKDGITLARMNLNQIIGRPLDSPIIAEEEGDAEGFIFSANGDPIEQRPEYQLLQKQAALKRAEMKLVRSDFMPTLGLRASYSYMRGVRLNNNLLFNTHGPSLMLQLSVPIFRWGESKHKLRAAEAEANTALLQAEELSQKMRLEMVQAEQKYHELESEVDMMRKILSQTEEHLRITRERHREGLETTATLLEAETLLSKAKSDLVITRGKLRVQQSVVEKAFGLLRP